MSDEATGPEEEGDFRPVPKAGDDTLANCFFECFRVIGKYSGLNEAENAYFATVLKFAIARVMLNDLYVASDLNTYDKLVVDIAARNLCTTAATYVNFQTGQHRQTLQDIQEIADSIEYRANRIWDAATFMPKFEAADIEPVASAEEMDFFGRFRREFSVEKLAGETLPPPIIRPVEMTLVPDRVSDFNEMTMAMRQCLHLCVLLSNQRNLIRNSYSLRMCLIQHLFVRVIPLPLPFDHPERGTRCFWHAQPMRYETQAEVLRLLNILCRHFATASLSIQMARSGDAVRILVFACMATMCDAAMRKIACDLPSQPSLHYSGLAKGPVKPFGFEVGAFAEESEYLKFVNPESASARTQVLDYFSHLEKHVPKENILFRFNESKQVGAAEKKFIDQLCLQMGFDRGYEKYFITGANSNFLDHYPEIGFFRDLLFMFKLVMVPTSDQLPELKPWTPEEAALIWSFNDDNYVVRGFNKELDCSQPSTTIEEEQFKSSSHTRPKGFFRRILQYIGLSGKQPRSTPSQANPSILLGERVDTEDDILHVLKLPDFDGTLGARDCELMLQYLTAPYLRIPLLLNFFSNEVRLKALRNESIQEVLDAALFEPGPWQSEPTKLSISTVPAENRDNLCSTAGLLFNELVMSPTLVMNSIYTMLERVLDMDTGKYSALSESILYILRLVIRVESYILFLWKTRAVKKEPANASKYYGGDYEADVRGLQCSDAIMGEALAAQKRLRSLLDDQVFKILARWIKNAKDDGQMNIACKLHAHIAYLFRNVQADDINNRAVFAILACQIFLFNNYKYSLDIGDIDGKKKKRKDDQDANSDLGIPQIELFDLFQVNRNNIMNWLLTQKEGCNEVMNSLVEMIEETEPKAGDSRDRTECNWMSIENMAVNFKGRFIPVNEYDPESLTTKLSREARVSFEVWMREVTTLAVSTEINAQLGEFTIKKHATQALNAEITENADFIDVFEHVAHSEIIQCAEVINLPRRKWLRLIGLNYDVQYWDADTRQIVHGYKIAYGGDEPAWVSGLLEPWMKKTMPGIDLYRGGKNYTKSDTAIYYGVWYDQDKTPESYTLKEVIVHKYPRFLEIFNIIEYGRRWYRSHCFSTDPRLSYFEGPMHALSLEDRLATCGGDPTVTTSPSPSVVILRYVEEEAPNPQYFIPERLLYGTLPYCLLKAYSFWQSEDETLTGVMVNKVETFFPKSTLKIKIRKVGKADNTGFGFENGVGLISRIIHPEGGVSSNNAKDAPRSQLYLLNPHSMLQKSFTGDLESKSTKSLASNFSKADERDLHGLIRLIIRLDSLSNALFWTKTIDGGKSPIDVIELPRLRLTFQRLLEPETGKYRYYSLEHAGYYIAETNSIKNLTRVLNGLDNAVVLRNNLGEAMVLLSALAKPSQFRIKKNSPAFRIVYSYADVEWNNNSSEVSYFIYPVHLSNTKLQSRSIASTLYLLTLLLMGRNYGEAFHIMDICVSDRPFNPQEQQIYDVLTSIRDRLLVDSAACRLKLFFVTYGCSDIMPYKSDLADDVKEYVTKFELVSASCRLTFEEESFILSNLPDQIKAQTPAMLNRERLLASLDLGFQNAVTKSKNKAFQPQYPAYTKAEPYHTEILDFDALTDTDKPSFKSFLQKITGVKYKRPDALSGGECIQFLNKVFDKEKNLGFFALYEIMGNGQQVCIIPDLDKPRQIASLLLHVLPDNYITGLQRLILIIMETHPNLTAQMPIFKDDRTFKIPTFAGLDIFQSHLKTVAAFLRANRQFINLAKLSVVHHTLYMPPPVLLASPAVAAASDCIEGRIWFTPRVKDYGCTMRTISRQLLPSYFQKTFCTHYTENEIRILATAPMLTSELQASINYIPALQPDASSRSDSHAIAVMNHPSSRSHIARTSVTRLEQDIGDFYTDVKATNIPYLKVIPTDARALEASNFQSILDSILALEASIIKLKESDVKFVEIAVLELLEICNGRHSVFRENDAALSHVFMQKAQQEVQLVSFLSRVSIMACCNKAIHLHFFNRLSTSSLPALHLTTMELI